YHPAGLNRGQRHLSGVFIHDMLVGLDIGANGWKEPELRVTPAPSPEQFRQFCELYDPSVHTLTYDIENPSSRGLDEDELEDEISWDIDRMSFCYDAEVGGYSVPFAEPFIAMAKGLLTSAGVKRGHNCRLHDRPRLERLGLPVLGREEDTLDAWRHLQRRLPAGVAYVAPFYLRMQPWKQEAHVHPEWYSAMDAIVQHRIGQGIERDLRATGQWETYQRHVVGIIGREGVATRMAEAGLPIDEKAV